MSDNDPQPLAEIADKARFVRGGYREAAENYLQWRNALEDYRSHSRVALPSNVEADLLKSTISAGKRCELYRAELIRLGNLVVDHLPDLWPTLVLVGSEAWWHEDAGFDWPAAEEELRRIEATARRVQNGDQMAAPGSDPMPKGVPLAVRSPTTESVNDAMMKIFTRDKRCVGWTLREWAETLGCGKSTVGCADAWKAVKRERADRKLALKKGGYRPNQK